MTLSINGNDIGQAIEIAIAVGGIVAMLVAGLVFYLLVRPPRKAKIPGAAPRRDDLIEAEEVLAVLDRMEQRLAVLERAVVADEAPRRIAAGDGQEELLQAGDHSPETRRT